MKTLFTLILALLSTSVWAQTTVEEYDYFLNQYPEDVEARKGIKKDYSIRDISDWGFVYEDFERVTHFRFIMRAGETRPCAILMTFERSDTGYIYHLVIPHYDSSEAVWDKAHRDYIKASEDWTEATQGYVWGMLRMISYQQAHPMD